eukprot:CAMPEP_0171114756 /NCGR_PEP_ID=MMETSP0766_2-20121228/86065_1 /TAXON_ID=439317 /ORGANISM="Gambierdiscus australes, Strain CAWD 149" /LENGTH=107 /DNA_ID=CAMNT_0011577059 /DNA_START=61 /DNA_END=380 /DNA_ORIENTATION=-
MRSQASVCVPNEEDGLNPKELVDRKDAALKLGLIVNVRPQVPQEDVLSHGKTEKEVRRWHPIAPTLMNRSDTVNKAHVRLRRVAIQPYAPGQVLLKHAGAVQDLGVR